MTADEKAWVPEACTLPTTEQPVRVREFDDLFATALRGVHRISPTRLRWWLDRTSEATARDLTARETRCCTFFTFTFAAAGEEVQLDVQVPGNHIDVLDALARRATAGIAA
jgi:hypothetical protein